METRAKYVLIGSFVIAVCIAMVLALLWAGKLSMDREFRLYDVYFRESVTGLAKGGPVYYNGIQIGEVATLRLSRIDPARVIARIRVGRNTPIKTDTEAKLAYTGLTGVAAIQLSGGTVEAPRLEPRPGRTIAVIRAQPSDLSRLFESGSDIVVTVNELLTRLASILSDENAERLSEAIGNLNQLTSAIGAESDAIQTILRQGARASTELGDTLVQVRALVERVESAVDGAATIMDQDVAEAMSALRQASQQVQALLDENRGALDQFAQESLVEVGQVMAELRSLLQSVRQISERLEDNPADFLLGRDQLLEFEP